MTELAYRGPGTEFRRRQKPRARRSIVVDGSVVQAGATLPDGVPLRDVDSLGSHGFVDRRPGDDGVDSG